MSGRSRWPRSRSAVSGSRWSLASDLKPRGRSATSTGDAKSNGGERRMLKNTRLVVAALAAIALGLGGLIYRDVFVGTKNAGNAASLYTVPRRTETATVTGTGNLVPMQQANVSFKVSGALTEIDVRVGDHVAAGQVLARIDPTNYQNALASSQANLALAQANLQSAETPLTQAQITQLRNNLANAQQQYNDTVAQVNLTNTQDANQVTTDQNQLTTDQQALPFNSPYQAANQTLTSAQATLQTAINQFQADGCNSQTYPYSR